MDVFLKDQVTLALGRSPYLVGIRLDLKNESGRLVLLGTVPSWFQKQMAQEAIRSVATDTEIKNEVAVREMKLSLP
ncbi:MAG: BON domain-containing protein [Planctomycetia bacterium]|nr:BON domain-containing protein [Planctomycetia bacterium]